MEQGPVLANCHFNLLVDQPAINMYVMPTQDQKELSKQTEPRSAELLSQLVESRAIINGYCLKPLSFRIVCNASLLWQ